MDKKNTMLLTVIAVATLLVAVVGATFAYFAVTNEQSSSSSAVNVQTEDIGVVSLSNDVQEMHITTTAKDFAQALGGTAAGRFYATEDPDTNYVAAAETNNVVVIGATGGAANTVYECTFKFTATTTANKTTTTGTGETATTETNPTTLVEGEYVVTLGGLAGSLGALDMSVEANRAVDQTVTVYLTGNTPKYITASAVLVNTAAEQQDRLANATIQTAFAASDINCDVVETAGTDSIAAN